MSWLSVNSFPLSWIRCFLRKRFLPFHSHGQAGVQLEEAYARATVAITRARAPCLIMGPLDERPFGGSYSDGYTYCMYGAGHVWLAMPIFIFMTMNSPVHRQMSHSLPCSHRTAAYLDRTSLPRQLWRPCKIMSRIITRYVAYTLLLLTCGGLGRTKLPEPERSLTNFGVFLMVMTRIG